MLHVWSIHLQWPLNYAVHVGKYLNPIGEWNLPMERKQENNGSKMVKTIEILTEKRQIW